MKGIVLIAVLLTMSLGVFAQADTSGRGGYVPIFDNLTTPGVPLPDDYNGKLRLTDSGDSTEVSIDEAVQNIKILYDAGRFNEALWYAYYVRTRKNDAKDKFSKLQTETLRKYSLASFVEMGYNRMADSLIVLFCNRNPFYKVKDGDPDAFVKLKEKFYSRPWLSIRASISKIYPVIAIDTVYGLRASDGSFNYGSIKSRSDQFDVIFYPHRNIALSAGCARSILEYSRQETGENVFFRYKENDQILSFPVELAYCFFTRRNIVTPEIYAGAKISTLSHSEYEVADLIRTKDVLNGNLPDTARYTGTHSKEKKIFASIFAGARISYNYRRFSVFVGFDYTQALGELRDPQRKYSDTKLLVSSQYTPDAIKVSQMAMTVGLKVSLFYKTYAKYGYGY